MTRRALMWAGVVLLFLLAVGGLWAIHGERSVTLTEAQIQERINKQLDKDFPVKGAAHLLLKTVNVKKATVHIQDGHVIALIDVEGTLRGNKKFTLTTYSVGVPTYSFGEFFFKPDKVEVQKFAYEGSTPTELFTRFARRYVSDDKTRRLIEDKAPKAEAWMTVVAENAATGFLARRPVYRPKDDVRGLLIKASLESVKVNQGHVVITFSLWQLTGSVLFGLLCLISFVVAAWVLIKHPFLGLTTIFLG
jgi:hypothetical protein